MHHAVQDESEDRIAYGLTWNYPLHPLHSRSTAPHLQQLPSRMIPPRPMIGVFPTYYVCFMIDIPEGQVEIRGEIREVGVVSDGPLKVVML